MVFIICLSLDFICAAIGKAYAFSAYESFAYIFGAVISLTAEALDFHAARVFKFDGEVIPDVSKFWVSANMSASYAIGFDGVSAHYPVCDIDVVDVLFDDCIARAPDVEVPVTTLGFHF